jgi:hypothetical protein
MNERIRQLAEQAGAGNRAGVSGLVFRDNELEKFAELIVKEFSQQVQIEGRFGLEREQTLIRLCCENAKKNFGVEE